VILAPILIGTGRSPREVAPAALASTFVTSVLGVITFLVLSVHHHGSVAPDWPTGIALGIGGLAGAYTGARIQRHLPDALIRRVMGVLVVAIGARYLWSGLGLHCGRQPRTSRRACTRMPGTQGTPCLGGSRLAGFRRSVARPWYPHRGAGPGLPTSLPTGSCETSWAMARLDNPACLHRKLGRTGELHSVG
jgi:hypothetical protein